MAKTQSKFIAETVKPLYAVAGATVLMNFLILAFVIFLLVRQATKIMKRADEVAGPTEVELLAGCFLPWWTFGGRDGLPITSGINKLPAASGTTPSRGGSIRRCTRSRPARASPTSASRRATMASG